MSQLEETFALQIRAEKLPAPEREVCLIPGRKFRVDFAWREQRIAFEVNGGTWVKSGHSSGAGLQRDYEKAALLQLEGYRVFSVSGQSVRDGTAIKWLKQALNANRDNARLSGGP